MATLHPELVNKINLILCAMTILGHPMKITQGVRTAEEQHALFTQVPKVTNCDGVVRKSRHQVSADGYGHAVDCAFVGVDPFNEHHPWRLYGEMGKALGLMWGGEWKSLVDRPHLELI